MKVGFLGIKRLPAFAGADRVVEKLTEHLAGTVDAVVFAGGGDDGDTDGRARSGKVELVRIAVRRGGTAGRLELFWKAAREAARRNDIEIYHVHNSDFGVFVPILARTGRPVVGTFHGDPYKLDKWGAVAKLYFRVAERFFARYSTVLTSVGPERESVRSLVRRRDVRFIPNGMEAIAVSDDRMRELRNRWDRLGVPFVLFAVGRIERKKGVHLVVEAARALRDVQFVIVGDFSHDRRYSGELAGRWEGLENLFVIDELLPREDLFALMKLSRLCLFPSYQEAMSMVLLEYIGCGRAVVCSDILPNRWVVGDGYPFVFPTGDGRRFIETVRNAWERADIEEVGVRLLEDCLGRMSWEVVAESYRELYEELLSETHDRSG